MIPLRHVGVDKSNSYRLVAANASGNEFQSAYQFFVTDSTGTTHTCQSTAVFNNDVWHYVVGTYDAAGHMILYVDGYSSAATTGRGPNSSPSRK